MACAYEPSNEETEIHDPWSSVARLYLYLFTYIWDLGFLTDHAQLVRGDEDLDSGPPASAASTLNHAPKSSSQPLITLFCKVNLFNESTG